LVGCQRRWWEIKLATGFWTFFCLAVVVRIWLSFGVGLLLVFFACAALVCLCACGVGFSLIWLFGLSLIWLFGLSLN
jgi:hypothetical protein